MAPSKPGIIGPLSPDCGHTPSRITWIALFGFGAFTDVVTSRGMGLVDCTASPPSASWQLAHAPLKTVLPLRSAGSSAAGAGAGEGGFAPSMLDATYLAIALTSLSGTSERSCTTGRIGPTAVPWLLSQPWRK